MSIDNSVKNAPSATGAPLIGSSFVRRAVNFLGRNGLIVGFILIVIVLSLSTPAFMKLSNLVNIIRQVSVNGILAVGETFVILLGGIDLSVGSGVALAGVLAAGLQTKIAGETLWAAASWYSWHSLSSSSPAASPSA